LSCCYCYLPLFCAPPLRRSFLVVPPALPRQPVPVSLLLFFRMHIFTYKKTVHNSRALILFIFFNHLFLHPQYSSLCKQELATVEIFFFLIRASHPNPLFFFFSKSPFSHCHARGWSKNLRALTVRFLQPTDLPQPSFHPGCLVSFCLHLKDFIPFPTFFPRPHPPFTPTKSNSSLPVFFQHALAPLLAPSSLVLSPLFLLYFQL